MRFVRTVLGDVAPPDLGPVDYHEHLFQTSPLLPGDDLDDEEASAAEAAALVASGAITAMVDATPVGLGRRPAAVARISRAVGLRIIMTTGGHHGGHYPDDHFLKRMSETELADRFKSELITRVLSDEPHGPPQHHLDDERMDVPLRAGLLKAGIRYWAIPPFERRVLGAVASAHAATGAPVMIHLEHGSAAHEVLDVLERSGVPADRVALAHMDRNPDARLHAELAGRGCYLGYDGMARHRSWPDSELVKLFAAVAAGPGRDRILLGGDVARRTRYVAYGGMPGLAYLPDRFLPRLRAEVGQAPVTTALIDNPARWLTWSAA